MAKLENYLHPDYVVAANFDSDTNTVTIELAQDVDLDEDALKMIVMAIDLAARGRRGDIDSPISEKENPDFSAMQPKLRKSSTDDRVETQIEYNPQFVFWLKYPDPRYMQAVNPVD
ncbi:MAG: hypothetical protein QXV73_05630 [Candidatus Micrarchaeia archaeon]